MICERPVQLSVKAELREVAGLLASINNAPSGPQEGRENETSILPGHRDKPEWVQFSGIKCNDRRTREERSARKRSVELMCKCNRQSSRRSGGVGPNRCWAL